jgi:hypothetical protein
MKLAGSRLLLIAAAAGLMTAAASPAFAWVCTAKNARGAHYTAYGVFAAGTCSRAIIKCQADSYRPRTCHVVSSHP